MNNYMVQSSMLKKNKYSYDNDFDEVEAHGF